jgi:hypothetical protein
MAHRLSRTLAAGVAGICLFGSDPVVAQETPVAGALTVAIKGPLPLVGVPQFVSTDAAGGMMPSNKKSKSRLRGFSCHERSSPPHARCLRSAPHR